MEDKERIIKVDIEQEMRKSYIDYSMSVIVARALPDVRDGFKPVHRRILFGMKELGNVHSKPYKKSARIVGEVLGKYHPHGDSSVYGALVRMAQEWAMRYTLVDGQGNFDDTLPEPTVMPTKIPNLLVNGATGIAVGMATNIPTHNLSEVIDACVAYIDNEDMDVEALMQYVKGPDFPTGAYIMGLQGIKDAYETGRGRVIMRAKADIESGDLHDKIIVTEIPYGVNKQQLIEYIAQLVSDKKLEGISNVNDESDREGMRIVVDVKRDANTRVVLNKLFKMTPLQTSFPVNSIALVKGRPQLLTLKDFISNFVKHRHEVTIRRTKYDLRKAEERAHILKGLIIASDNIDEVVQIIKKSKTPVDAQRALEERFNLDELQSKAIVDMRLAQLTGLNQEKLHAEFDELMEKIKYYNQILTDDNLCRKVMKDELTEIKDQFGDERRTEILPSAEEFNAEDFYADDEVVVTISHLGYVKRIPLAEFKAQNRGGIGVKATATRDNDFVEKIYPATMHNTMMFFTERGRCYWLKVYDIPEGSKNNKGRAIQNMLNIDAGDSVTNCLCIRKLNDPDFCKSHYVMFATKQGIIKKTCLTEYSRVRTNGVNAINIREDDSVVAVELTNGKNEIIVANAGGRAVRFNESEVRPMGRVSTGVQSIILDKDPRDGVIGMCVINDVENESIMVLSENGFGKRTDVEEYRKTSRHCKGVKTIAITEKTGYLVAILVVKDEDDLMIINKSGVTIRLHADDIKTTKSRVTQGVKVIELKKRNDVISHLSVVPRSDEEEETAETAEASEETATENESNE